MSHPTGSRHSRKDKVRAVVNAVVSADPSLTPSGLLEDFISIRGGRREFAQLLSDVVDDPATTPAVKQRILACVVDLFRHMTTVNKGKTDDPNEMSDEEIEEGIRQILDPKLAEPPEDDDDD